MILRFETEIGSHWNLSWWVRWIWGNRERWRRKESVCSSGESIWWGILISALGFVYSTCHTYIHWKGLNGAKHKWSKDELENFATRRNSLIDWFRYSHLKHRHWQPIITREIYSVLVGTTCPISSRIYIPMLVILLKIMKKGNVNVILYHSL